MRRAENGTEALNATSVEAPDIIVTDVMRPGMDGMALVRALRAVPLLAHIPVIMTAAINVPRVLPLQAFLRKPFSEVELVDLIDRLLA
ncbi:response regulator [Paraburkholderia sediminicola]|uniref:response regulator transcription factor n=1 Tax=Paraburkholderia sediminicola TaxID=458836 RepID=UPI0038B97AB0